MLDRRFSSLAVFATATVLLASCGGSGNDDAAPPSIETVTPIAVSANPRQQHIDNLNAESFRLLDARDKAMLAITTPAAMDARKAEVRAKILNLIGGLPQNPTPVQNTVYKNPTGGTAGTGYRTENIIYESLPGFKVTANVFIPTDPQYAAPYPAVFVTPGHGATGKQGDFVLAANLARAGILVMTTDVLGNGERIQYYKAGLTPYPTLAGRPFQATGEHSMAFWQTMLTGDHVSRYFIFDAQRGLDYLASRSDVDNARLGAYGCSGGGAVTAYLAAIETRLKVAVSACFANSYRTMLQNAPGPQEAEQSIPGFIAAGLDLPDWIELAAPTPYAIVSTTDDTNFPFPGATAAYLEALRVWNIYGATDRLSWITGPGGHGALTPVMPQIVTFLTRWLKNDTTIRPFDNSIRATNTNATETGQLATTTVVSGVKNVQQLNSEREALRAIADPVVASASDLASLQNRLKTDIRQVTGAIATETSTFPTPVARVGEIQDKAAYRLQTLKMNTDNKVLLDARWAVHPGSKGKTLLLLDTYAVATADQAGSRLDTLARAGWNVLAIQARGTVGESTETSFNPNNGNDPKVDLLTSQLEEVKSDLIGNFNFAAIRALLAGKTVLGQRIDDSILAINWLKTQGEVDPAAISVYGVGVMAPVAVHAAVLDARIANLYTQSLLASYRMGVDMPAIGALPAVALPGVLRKYDMGHLLLATAPRRVVAINPVDAMGDVLARTDFEAKINYVLKADQSLGNASRVTWSSAADTF